MHYSFQAESKKQGEGEKQGLHVVFSSWERHFQSHNAHPPRGT